MSASHDKCITGDAQMRDPRAVVPIRGQLEPPRLTVYKDLGSTSVGCGVPARAMQTTVALKRSAND